MKKIKFIILLLLILKVKLLAGPPLINDTYVMDVMSDTWAKAYNYQTDGYVGFYDLKEGYKLYKPFMLYYSKVGDTEKIYIMTFYYKQKLVIINPKTSKIIKTIGDDVIYDNAWSDIMENPVTHYKYIFYRNLKKSDVLMIFDENDNIVKKDLGIYINSGLGRNFFDSNKSFFSKDGKYLYSFTKSFPKYFYKIDAKTGDIIYKRDHRTMANLNTYFLYSDNFNDDYLLLSTYVTDQSETSTINIMLYNIKNDTLIFKRNLSRRYLIPFFYSKNDTNLIVFQYRYNKDGYWAESKKCYIYDFRIKKVVGEIMLSSDEKYLKKISGDKLILEPGYRKQRYEHQSGYTFENKDAQTTFYHTPIELKTYPWEMP